MRSATSIWNISVRLDHQGSGSQAADNQPTSRGVPTV